MGAKLSKRPYEEVTGDITLSNFLQEVEDIEGTSFSFPRMYFEKVPNLKAKLVDLNNTGPYNHFYMHSKYWYTLILYTRLPSTNVNILCVQVDPFENPGFTEADIPYPVRGKIPKLELQQLGARCYLSSITTDSLGKGIFRNEHPPDYSRYPDPSYHIMLIYYVGDEENVHAMSTASVYLSSKPCLSFYGVVEVASGGDGRSSELSMSSSSSGCSGLPSLSKAKVVGTEHKLRKLYTSVKSNTTGTRKGATRKIPQKKKFVFEMQKQALWPLLSRVGTYNLVERRTIGTPEQEEEYKANLKRKGNRTNWKGGMSNSRWNIGSLKVFRYSL
eukprot:CFRG3502T1